MQNYFAIFVVYNNQNLFRRQNITIIHLLMKKVILLITAALSLMAVGCQREVDVKVDGPSDVVQNVTFGTIPVNLSKDTDTGDPETKSLISVETEQFSCAYLFAFWGDGAQKGQICEYPTYAGDLEGTKPVAVYTDNKSFQWALPIGKPIDVYALVNPPSSLKDILNDYVENGTTLTEDILAGLKFVCDSPEDLAAMDTSGDNMPMSGIVSNTTLESVDSRLEIKVKRLFAKYEIKLDVTNFKNEKWEILAAGVDACMSNTEVPYFYTGAGAGFKQESGSKLKLIDTSTSNDITLLNYRSAVDTSYYATFYFLENCQGDIYVDNAGTVEASKWNKVAEELGAKVANCSYLNIKVRANKQDYGERNFMYRIYLGNEATMKKNFDIIRNKHKRVTIKIGAPTDGFTWTPTTPLSVAAGETVTIPFETTLQKDEIVTQCYKSGVLSDELQLTEKIYWNPTNPTGITEFPYSGYAIFRAKSDTNDGTIVIYGGDNGHDIWSPTEIEIVNPIDFYAGLGLTDAGADLGEGDPAVADTWIKTFPVIINSNINPLDYIVTAGFEPVDRFPLSEFNPHSKSLIKIYGWIHNGDNADGTTNYEVVYGFDFSNFGETAQDIHPDFAAIPYNVTLYIRHKDDPDWPEENIDPDNPATAGNEWFHFKKHCAMYVGATPTKEVVSTDTYNAEYVMTVTPVWGPCIPVGIKFDEVTGTLSDASVVTVMNTSNEYYDIIKAPASAPLPVEAAGRLYPSSIDGELSYQRLPGDPDQYSVTFNGKNSVGADWANKFMYYNAPLFYDWDAQPWVELDDELRLYLYPYGSLSGYWELDSVRGQDYKWFNYNADTSVRIKSRNSRYEFDFYTCIDYGRNDIGATNYRLYTGDYAFTFKTIQNPNPNEEEIPVFEYDGHSATIQTPRGVKNIEDVISSIDLTVVPKFRTLYYDMDYVHYYVSYAFTNLTGTNKNIIQLTPASAEVTGNYWYFRGFPTRERPRSLHNVETPPANVEKYGRFTSFTIENDSQLEDKKYGGYKRWQEIFVMDNYFIRADIRFKAEYADLVKDWNIRTNLKETFPVWINDTYF